MVDGTSTYRLGSGVACKSLYSVHCCPLLEPRHAAVEAPRVSADVPNLPYVLVTGKPKSEKGKKEKIVRNQV